MDKGDEFYTVRGYQLLNQGDRLLTSGMEDYLEMIYREIEKEGYMRINILSERLNVKPSSATNMVQKLAKLGLLDYRKYGIIFLTEEGKKYGKFLLERHNIIEKFLNYLGNTGNLLTETELIEHNISDSTMKNIDLLNRFFETNSEILDGFKSFKSRSETES